MSREIVISDLATYVGMHLVREVFVASMESVSSSFPGWRQPLSHTVRRQLRNPFSGDLMHRPSGDPYMIDTREPDGPWRTDVPCPILDPFPRRDFTPIGHGELTVLARCLCALPELIESALFAPPDYGWFLWSLPKSLSAGIAAIPSIESAASSWLAALRVEPDVDWEDLSQVDDWPAELSALAELAQRAVAQESRLFLYQGPLPPPRDAA